MPTCGRPAGHHRVGRLHRVGRGWYECRLDRWLATPCRRTPLGNGLQERLDEAQARADEATLLRLRNEAAGWSTLPSEMGERFQVMGFSRDVEFGAAFLFNDLSWRL